MSSWFYTKSLVSMSIYQVSVLLKSVTHFLMFDANFLLFIGGSGGSSLLKDIENVKQSNHTHLVLCSLKWGSTSSLLEQGCFFGRHLLSLLLNVING